MATIAENLQTAYASLSAKYAAAAAAATPNYSIDGQTVDRVGYMESLLKQMSDLRLQLATADGPVEVETEGFI